ncbi:hypothetical protein Hanom_Chr14g01293951 [Helianthus anomalus]
MIAMALSYPPLVVEWWKELWVSLETRVRSPLVTFGGKGNDGEGLRPEPEPTSGFHPAVTLARLLVWRQYGFRGKVVTKSDSSAGPVKTT